MDDWLTMEQIAPDTWRLSEYRHWEETHCYLLLGRDRGLVIDTGLGIGDIREPLEALTDMPLTAVATHVHWDHVGGHWHFPAFYAHALELPWLQGAYPQPVEAVRAMVADRCRLPEGFDVNAYQLFQGTPAALLADGDEIGLGGRSLRVLHTPGHSPGHMCFYEADRGWLFTGDLVYRGELLAFFPSTDPAAYLQSLERIAALPVERVLPGHHDPDLPPEIVPRTRDAFRRLWDRGQLRHEAGTFRFGDWSVRL